MFPACSADTIRSGVLTTTSASYEHAYVVHIGFSTLTYFVPNNFTGESVRCSFAEENYPPFPAMCEFQTLVMYLMSQFTGRGKNQSPCSLSGVTTRTRRWHIQRGEYWEQI